MRQDVDDVDVEYLELMFTRPACGHVRIHSLPECNRHARHVFTCIPVGE